MGDIPEVTKTLISDFITHTFMNIYANIFAFGHRYSDLLKLITFAESVYEAFSCFSKYLCLLKILEVFARQESHANICCSFNAPLHGSRLNPANFYIR